MIVRNPRPPLRLTREEARKLFPLLTEGRSDEEVDEIIIEVTDPPRNRWLLIILAIGAMSVVSMLLAAFWEKP